MLLKVNDAILCHFTDLNKDVLGHFPSLDGMDVTFMLFSPRCDLPILTQISSIFPPHDLIYLMLFFFQQKKNHSITFKNATRNVGQFLQS